MKSTLNIGCGHTAERLKVLEMLDEGKINGEEAKKLLEQLDKITDEETQGRGWSGWMNKILFAFIPMLLAIGTGIGLLYLLCYYLPFHLTFDKMGIIYGLIAIIILCITLIAIAAIGVGRLAVSRKFKVVKGDKVVELGGQGDKKDFENKVVDK